LPEKHNPLRRDFDYRADDVIERVAIKIELPLYRSEQHSPAISGIGQRLDAA